MQVQFYLKRPNDKVPTVIWARITYSGQMVKYYLKESILPSQWSTTKHREKTKVGKASHLNSRLDRFETDVKDEIRRFLVDRGEVPAPDDLKVLLDVKYKNKATKDDKVNEKPTFFSFFDQFIADSESGVRVHPSKGTPFAKGTIQVYHTIRKSLQEFSAVKGYAVDFDSIDLQFYRALHQYIIHEKKYTQNYHGNHIKTIRTVLNDATEKGINTNMIYKSKHFKKIQTEADTIHLNLNELQAIEKLDLSDNPRLDNARDQFLIACHTGLRYSDYKKLSVDDIKRGTIEFCQTKTSEPIVMPVNPVVKRIFEKNGERLPVLIANANLNKYIKEVGQMIPELQIEVSQKKNMGGKVVIQKTQKWKLITTHTARRSFATVEYDEGTPVPEIMALTGHKTQISFFKYIKRSPNSHVGSIKNRWDARYALQ